MTVCLVDWESLEKHIVAFYLVRASEGFEARHSDSIQYSGFMVWCYPSCRHTCCATCFLKGNSYTYLIYMRNIPFLTQDVAQWLITHLKVPDILRTTQDIWTAIIRFLYHATWWWTFPSSILNWRMVIHAGKHIAVTLSFYTYSCLQHNLLLHALWKGRLVRTELGLNLGLLQCPFVGAPGRMHRQLSLI